MASPQRNSTQIARPSESARSHSAVELQRPDGTNESFQFVGIGQPKWRTHDSYRGSTNVSLQCVSQNSKSGTFVNAVPHHQRESSFGTKNPTHFA
jgi:hypothetical protein